MLRETVKDLKTAHYGTISWSTWARGGSPSIRCSAPPWANARSAANAGTLGKQQSTGCRPSRRNSLLA